MTDGQIGSFNAQSTTKVVFRATEILKSFLFFLSKRHNNIFFKWGEVGFFFFFFLGGGGGLSRFGSYGEGCEGGHADQDEHDAALRQPVVLGRLLVPQGPAAEEELDGLRKHAVLQRHLLLDLQHGVRGGHLHLQVVVPHLDLHQHLFGLVWVAGVVSVFAACLLVGRMGRVCPKRKKSIVSLV